MPWGWTVAMLDWILPVSLRLVRPHSPWSALVAKMVFLPRLPFGLWRTCIIGQKIDSCCTLLNFLLAR